MQNRVSIFHKQDSVLSESIPPPRHLGPENKFWAILVKIAYQASQKPRTNVKCTTWWAQHVEVIIQKFMPISCNLGKDYFWFCQFEFWNYSFHFSTCLIILKYIWKWFLKYLKCIHARYGHLYQTHSTRHKNTNKIKKGACDKDYEHTNTIKKCRNYLKSPNFIKSLESHSFGYILLY